MDKALILAERTEIAPRESFDSNRIAVVSLNSTRTVSLMVLWRRARFAA